MSYWEEQGKLHTNSALFSIKLWNIELKAFSSFVMVENFQETREITVKKRGSIRIRARARGTDLVRLRPASASVRFLEILTGPPSECVLEADVKSSSATVPFGRYFIGPWSASVPGRPFPSHDPWSGPFAPYYHASCWSCRFQFWFCKRTKLSNKIMKSQSMMNQSMTFQQKRMGQFPSQLLVLWTDSESKDQQNFPVNADFHFIQQQIVRCAFIFHRTLKIIL